MKKSLLLIIIFTVLMMTGCGDKGQMTNYIPTPAPESEDSSDTTEDLSGNEDTDSGSVTPDGEDEETPSKKPLHVGQTTTMYVKLDKYDAILNVRATPSKDGDVVGFLVHTEKVAVIEIVDGWASFAQGDEIRYVSADFLVDERPEYIKPPTPTQKPTPTSKPTQNDTPEEDTEEAPPEI